MANSTDFLYFTPKEKGIEAKINKQDYIKMKSNYKAKEIINKMKSLLAEWEKIMKIIHVIKGQYPNVYV